MIKKILIITLLIPLIFGCQTVQDKTNNIVEKEEKYLEKFINKKIDKVIQEFGEPTNYFNNYQILILITLITCFLLTNFNLKFIF